MPSWFHAVSLVLGMALLLTMMAAPFLAAAAWFMSKPPEVRWRQIKHLFSR